ncbi:MAG: LysR substrate-binding domain-containing protein [Pseudomonadota bacterium]
MKIAIFSVNDIVFVMYWDDRLRLRHITTFLEIARHESVSKAALALNLSQPAASRSLRELEEILGVELFERLGRGLRLNAEGRVFQAHATTSITELMRGRTRVAAKGGAVRRLSVGSLPTAAGALVPMAALAFRTKAPETRLSIMTGPNWLLFNLLREARLDLVVGRMPEGDRVEGLIFEQLYVEGVVLVCRPGHPVLTNPDVPAALLDYPLILPPSGAVIAATVERYLASIGLTGLKGDFETVALPVGRRITAASDALWFISRGVVEFELANRHLAAIDLKSPLLSGPVGISRLASAPVDVARTIFVECVRDASSDHPRA